MVSLPEFITITDKGIIVPKQEIKLVSSKDPILYQSMPYFDFEKHNAIEIANDLIDMLKKYGGVGLAANQIGYKHRVFVAGKDDNIVAYFNPEILAVSIEKLSLEEGCLSFPGLFLKVTRPDRIRVRYQDFNGVFHEEDFSGLTSRVYQHELDHCNGVVFTSHVGSLALSMAKEKRNKLEKKIERAKK